MPISHSRRIIPPIIGIAGWKKSGKTTLAVRLIEEFTRRGFKVASVKHAHYGFQIDNEETDSARHRRAGATEVAVVSDKRWAIVHELSEEPEPDFEEVISWLSPTDIVIVEGYKSAAIPKIEARRQQSLTQRPLSDDDPLVIAIAADHEIPDAKKPVLDLNDISAIADLIAHHIGPLQARFGSGAEKTGEPSRADDHQMAARPHLGTKP